MTVTVTQDQVKNYALAILNMAGSNFTISEIVKLEPVNEGFSDAAKYTLEVGPLHEKFRVKIKKQDDFGRHRNSQEIYETTERIAQTGFPINRYIGPPLQVDGTPYYVSVEPEIEGTYQNKEYDAAHTNSCALLVAELHTHTLIIYW